MLITELNENNNFNIVLPDEGAEFYIFLYGENYKLYEDKQITITLKDKQEYYFKVVGIVNKFLEDNPYKIKYNLIERREERRIIDNIHSIINYCTVWEVKCKPKIEKRLFNEIRLIIKTQITKFNNKMEVTNNGNK